MSRTIDWSFRDQKLPCDPQALSDCPEVRFLYEPPSGNGEQYIQDIVDLFAAIGWAVVERRSMDLKEYAYQPFLIPFVQRIHPDWIPLVVEVASDEELWFWLEDLAMSVVMDLLWPGLIGIGFEYSLAIGLKMELPGYRECIEQRIQTPAIGVALFRALIRSSNHIDVQTAQCSLSEAHLPALENTLQCLRTIHKLAWPSIGAVIALSGMHSASAADKALQMLESLYREIQRVRKRNPRTTHDLQVLTDEVFGDYVPLLRLRMRSDSPGPIMLSDFYPGWPSSLPYEGPPYGFRRP